jgi:hypothetical protein
MLGIDRCNRELEVAMHANALPCVVQLHELRLQERYTEADQARLAR